MLFSSYLRQKNTMCGA